MGFTVWLCVLCLQASLLSHAFDCSGASRGELCVSGQTADGQSDDQTQQRGLPLPEGLALFRRKRQLERRDHTHLSHSSLPGAVSVKGFPKTLIQADRSRRHLVTAASKKRRNKLRPGSFSVIVYDKETTPVQLIRARRQVKLDPAKRGKSGRSGAFSVLGDPQTDGQSDRAEWST
ncbi:uncharacterized protein si:dkey-12l12.1 [Pelmatolapia mariae]|uniref:uncharacterized protein si:dkey-12l12.1 n=1 Tax=Pelmatolapia mariae TaxID=158779 RepID=UPI002FE5CA5C